MDRNVVIRGLTVFTVCVLLAFAPGLLAGSNDIFICGDLTGDGTVSDIADLVQLVNYMFAGGTPPANLAAADCDGSGGIDIADLVCFIRFMFEAGPVPDCWVADHEDDPGLCLSLPETAKADGDEEYMYTEADGNRIHIYHVNAYYNCCIGYLVEYRREGFQIQAFEHDTATYLCACLCNFNTVSTLYYMDDGTYTITLWGGYDYLYHGGDPVIIGVDTVEVSATPVLIDYWNDPCEIPDTDGSVEIINYQFSDGILSFDHMEASSDCMAQFTVDFSLTGDTIRLYERKVSELVAGCTCEYDIHARVDNLMPGTYVAELYVQPYPGSPDLLYDRREIILED